MSVLSLNVCIVSKCLYLSSWVHCATELNTVQPARRAFRAANIAVRDTLDHHILCTHIYGHILCTHTTLPTYIHPFLHPHTLQVLLYMTSRPLVSVSLPAYGCMYVCVCMSASVSVSVFVSVSVSVSVCLSVCHVETHKHTQRLSLTFHLQLCLSLSVSVCFCASPYVFVCPCLS